MTELNYPLTADGGPDDLPRTLRRERDAREREARERQAKEREALAAQAPQPAPATAGFGGPNLGGPAISGAGMADPFALGEPSYGAHAEPLPATVRRFDVPFGQLVTFFLKAVFAMVPALILLGVILWGLGWTLQTFFPQLVKMQILIWFPN